VKTNRVTFDVCDGCLAGLNHNNSISIYRCTNCKRTACACVIYYRGAAGYECVEDVDDGCMKSAPSGEESTP